MKAFLPPTRKFFNFAKLKLSLVIFASLFSFFAVKTTVQAVENGTISAFPTNQNNTDPRSKSWFIYGIPGGMDKKDSVTVENQGENPITLQVYAVDSTETSEGSFALKNESDPKYDVGSWVKLSVSEVTLGAKESKKIPFTITVPLNAEKGEHSGGIIFQTASPKKLETKGMGINVVSRVGVRIYETVPGEDSLNLRVDNLHHTTVDDQLTFSFMVENKGTAHVIPSGFLEVKDMLGRTLDKINLDSMLVETVPGQPVTVTVPTKIVPPVLGWASATVYLYSSPTKVAIASEKIVANPQNMFLVIFIMLVMVAYFVAKHYLVKTNPKTHKTVLAPHIKLIVTLILLGVVLVSSALSLLLNKFLVP